MRNAQQHQSTHGSADQTETHTGSHLYVIVEDQVVVPVALQQRQRMRHLEILKLQHCVRPARHHSIHKLQTRIGSVQHCFKDECLLAAWHR
jgi:hypothetical protein